VYDKESSCLVLYSDLCKTKLVVIVALLRAERKTQTFACLCYSTPTVPGRSSNVEHRGHKKKWCGPGFREGGLRELVNSPYQPSHVNFRGHTRG
jgi:hypothetical protein